jgi:hypothetical protein
MRLERHARLACVALLSAALLTVGGCKDTDASGASGAPSAPAGPTLAGAKADLEKAGSYRYLITMKVDLGGTGATQKGTVEVALRDGKAAAHSTVEIDYVGLYDKQDVALEVIDVDGQLYAKGTDIGTKAKPWKNLTSKSKGLGWSVASLLGTPILDLRQYLGASLQDFQAAAASPKPTKFDGATAARFDVDCQLTAGCEPASELKAWLAAHAPGTPSLSFVATIDPATSRLLRFTADYTLVASSTNSSNVTITAVLEDVDKPITITAPPKASVSAS